MQPSGALLAIDSLKQRSGERKTVGIASGVVIQRTVLEAVRSGVWSVSLEELTGPGSSGPDHVLLRGSLDNDALLAIHGHGVLGCRFFANGRRSCR